MCAFALTDAYAYFEVKGPGQLDRPVGKHIVDGSRNKDYNKITMIMRYTIVDWISCLPQSKILVTKKEEFVIIIYFSLVFLYPQ